MEILAQERSYFIKSYFNTAIYFFKVCSDGIVAHSEIRGKAIHFSDILVWPYRKQKTLPSP